MANDNTGTAIADPREQAMRSLLATNLKGIQASMGDTSGELSKQLCAAMLSEASRVPQLFECTPASLIDCVKKAASLRLPFGGVLGHAYMVPFKNKGRLEATFIIGYKGLLQLARRSGEIADIRVTSVHKGDHFEIAYGLHPKLEHVPNFDNDRSAATITHVYAVCRLKGLGPEELPVWDCWTRQEVEAHKKRFCKSASREDSAWNTDWEAMAHKTVLRRMCNRGRIPLSVEDLRIVQSSDETLRRLAEANGGGSSFAQAVAAAGTIQELAGAIGGPRKPDPEVVDATATNATAGYLDRVEAATTKAELDSLLAEANNDHANINDAQFGDIKSRVEAKLAEVAQ